MTNNDYFLEPIFQGKKVEKISLCTSFDTELQDPDLLHFHLPADANAHLSELENLRDSASILLEQYVLYLLVLSTHFYTGYYP